MEELKEVVIEALKDAVKNHPSEIDALQRLLNTLLYYELEQGRSKAN